MAEHRRKRRRRPGVVALVPLALLASSAVVYQASNAAFSAQTDNPANNWTAGSVVLTDNDGGSALFSVTGVKPGDTGTRCITVTYNGTLASQVRLYAVNYTSTAGTNANGTAPNGLGPYLNLTVEEGTIPGSPSATNGDCTGFTAESPVNWWVPSGETVATFAAARTNYGNGATGVTSWTPSAAASYRIYRFIWSMKNVGDSYSGGTLSQTNVDDLQAAQAQVTFRWEAQNT